MKYQFLFSFSFKNYYLQNSNKYFNKIPSNISNQHPKDPKIEQHEQYNLNKRQIHELQSKLLQLLKEKSKLQMDNKNLKDENSKLQMDIKNLEKEISNISKQCPSQQSHQQNKAIELLDEEAIQNLEKLEEVGSGGGGKVFKVFKKEIYALKEMNIQKSDIKDFQNFLGEYEIMNCLDHPNILKTYGIFTSSESKPPSFLIEYCPMNLQQAIERNILTKEQIIFSIYQIAEGMKYVHFNKIIHRDLKPTNILIGKEGTIKICDFGISKVMTSEKQTMTRGIGTQKYMAPEIINEDEHYDEKVDVYSFGVIVFFVLGGNLSKIKIIDIARGKKPEFPTNFTQPARELISNCWNYESKDRPSFNEILDQLSRNHYKLLELSKSEIKSIETMVLNHKSKIPTYES